MDNSFFFNLIIFVSICILTYIIFSNINFQEGLENKSGSSTSSSSSSSSSSSNGIAGEAATYGANIKNQVIQLQDALLISKYRSDYENVIINMDDLVSNLMLKTILTIDQSKPEDGLTKLAALGQAKAALNVTMKFVDKS
jgi:hypothetical protein